MRDRLPCVSTAVTDLLEEVSLTPLQAVGIPIAILGALLMAIGAQFQHRGVSSVEDTAAVGASIGLAGLRRLLGSPSWVVGTILLGIAVIVQLVALWFAPLIVVQPLGAIALVATAIINARVANLRLDRGVIKSILYCLLGIAIFVTVAAFYAVERPLKDEQVWTVLALLVVVGGGLAIAWAVLRKRTRAIFFIAVAGIVYGFVVTLTKVVLNRINSGNFDLLTVVCIIGCLAALVLGMYFVQLAHASGPPDLVIAGLTVIDPLVAVLIGVTVLGEAAATPPWALIVFAGAGALAVFGVFQLAKHHPQLRS